MQIAVRSRNVEVTEALRNSVEAKLHRFDRYFDGMEVAQIRLREERNPRIADRDICEITLADGHGHIVRARAAAPDVTTAVDRVMDKLAHQLEKTRGKILGRSHPGGAGAPRYNPGSAGPRLPNPSFRVVRRRRQ